MAVPSRSYVGVLVFGLIATCLVVPYTILVVSGYQPPPDTPADVWVPPVEASMGLKVFLAVASLLSVGLTWAAWRNLLRAARRDARVRQHVAQQAQAPTTPRAAPAPPDVPPAPKKAREEPPPGYQ